MQDSYPMSWKELQTLLEPDEEEPAELISSDRAGNGSSRSKAIGLRNVSGIQFTPLDGRRG